VIRQQGSSHNPEVAGFKSCPATKEIPATAGISSSSATARTRLAPTHPLNLTLVFGGSLGVGEARPGALPGTERNRAAETGSPSS
jgi:hypothetical protein